MIVKKMLAYIKERKGDFEVSRFEGDIMWFSDIVITPSAVAFGIHQFLLFPQKSHDAEYLVSNINELVTAVGASLYYKYLGNTQKFREGFYACKEDYWEKFQLLMASEGLDRERYADFLISAFTFARYSLTSFEGLDKYLSKKIEETFPDVIQRALLTTPLYTSFIKQFDLALIACIQKLSPAQRSALISNKKFDGLDVMVEQFRLEHAWVFLNFGSWELPSGEFLLNLMRECARTMRSECAKIKKMQAIRQKKRALLKRLPRAKRAVIDLYDCVVELRDQRKAVLITSAVPFKKWLVCVGREYGLGYEQMRLLRWNEQCALSTRTKDRYRARAQARNKGCIFAYGFSKESPVVFSGAKANALMKEIFYREKKDVLTGTPASGGVVRGTVRCIASSKEFASFRQGDILVASHTTPDFITVMKKASAILTERGGITTHASLVSRELKIPCIVGITGLIASLATGDHVEVDANVGSVKKIG